LDADGVVEVGGDDIGFAVVVHIAHRERDGGGAGVRVDHDLKRSVAVSQQDVETAELVERDDVELVSPFTSAIATAEG